MSISTATIQFIDDGVPHAQEFGDNYFSDVGGLAETRYVFIQQNALESRWLAAANSNRQSPFVIAETGFGTGLNFLATWQAFKKLKSDNPNCDSLRLHFISTEKFPIALADLKIVLAKWEELGPLADQLISSYPHIVAGCHRTVFEQGQIILDLWLGDANESLSQMHNLPGGLVDAWFLDGFAPSKNPEMWTDLLFQQVARLSKHHATFTTFTVAGVVRRGLASNGFGIEKSKGFGRKREMLTGVFEAENANRQLLTFFHRQGIIDGDQANHVAIIGGGMASANLALSLVQRGLSVTIYCKDSQLAQGASGNPQGGFYPQLNAESNISSQIQAIAFQFAKLRYRQLLADGFEFSHQWCGVLQLAFKQAVQLRQQNLFDNQCWPRSLINAVSAKQAAEIAKIDLPYDGLFIADGGWISPPELVHALIQSSKAGGNLSLEMCNEIKSIKQHESGWQLLCEKQTFSADVVVIANGEQGIDMLECDPLPFQAVRGQVEAIPTFAPLTQLGTVLCHKGYLTPVFQGHHALGSTYVKNDRDTEFREQESMINIDMHVQALGDTEWAATLKKQHVENSARAAIRCSLPDHLPAVGSLFSEHVQRHQFADLYKALPISRYTVAENLPNLFVLSGLGSRGLTTAPLMAELLASQIAEEPLPFSSKLLNALNPNRFLIKKLIKRE